MPSTTDELLIKPTQFWKVIGSYALAQKFPNVLTSIQTEFSKYVIEKLSKTKPNDVFRLPKSSKLLIQLTFLYNQLNQAQLTDEANIIAGLQDELINGSTNLIALIHQHAAEEHQTQTEAAEDIIQNILPTRAPRTDEPRHIELKLEASTTFHEKAEIQQSVIDKDALFYDAVTYGQVDLARELVNDVNVNRELPGGKTLLMSAVIGKHTNIIELLIEEKADVNKATVEGITPLMLAVLSSDLDVINMLFQKGAKANLAMPDGTTALSLAFEEKNEAVIKLLILNKANVNQDLGRGWTPLLMCAANGYVEIFELLLRSGADMNLELPDGSNVFSLASDREYHDIKKLILHKKFNEQLTPKEELSSGAKLLLEYFEARNGNESKEEMPSIVKKTIMMLYIEKHPTIPMEFFESTNDQLNRLLNSNAKEYQSELLDFSKKMLKPKDFDKFVKLVLDPVNYLKFHCEQNIDAIRKLQRNNSMYEPHPNIEQYNYILRLDDETKEAIAQVMKEKPDFIEIFFTMKEAFADMTHYLTTDSLAELLNFTYDSNEHAASLVEELKSVRNQLSDIGLVQLIASATGNITEEKIKQHAEYLQSTVTQMANKLMNLYQDNQIANPSVIIHAGKKE